ncbi:MAG TPA: hypothetical protein VEE85_01935 [Candidatus Bathyarchaeia archaeon]|nr:hypothetical protein [Candidatus Bathyarchaeia archaeon]
MTVQESVREAAQLRLKMHVNGRLRLETLAALSRVFREHGEPIRDELLSSLVFAVPGELLGEAPPGNGYDEIRAHGKPSIPPPRPEPGRPPIPPPPRGPGRPSVPGK